MVQRNAAGQFVHTLSFFHTNKVKIHALHDSVLHCEIYLVCHPVHPSTIGVLAATVVIVVACVHAPIYRRVIELSLCTSLFELEK